MGDKTNKLHIFLIKSEIDSPADIVVDGVKLFEIDGVGTFYVEESFVKPPSWLSDFFGNALDGQFNILTASAKAVLLIPIQHGDQARIFAVAFGHGRNLLNDGVFEERFGLKVVLNSVYRDSLRSIDKTALGAVPKQSREQISREGEAASFGIDIEQDMLNAVTGRANDVRLGKTISGRDSLAISVKIDLGDILDFLPICLEKYESDAYKQDFEWIDQVADVRDPKKVADLNQWLLDRLDANELEKIWMAPPEIVDWVDVKGFRYGSKKRADLHLDLDVATFLESLGDAELSLELLKNKKVFAISARNESDFAHWSVYRCIYAEARIDERVFILNNGKWYEIAESFTQEVLDEFENIPDSEIVLPNYEHGNEGEYNESIPAVLAGSYCMDRKLVSYGGGHSTIEFCDLMTADKRLVHIKRYSGSAQLSHLFSQGVVSGELFVSDEKFREKVNERLPEAHKIPDVAARPNPSDYEVVFAIISKSNNPLDIPFFSKVALRNARRRLRGFGYKVTRKKISNLPASEG